jgi:pimeloyl-ACP methyl ester carboxylesterase
MELAAFSKKIERLILVNSTSHKGYPLFKKDSNGKPIETQVYENKESMALDPVQVAPVLIALKNQYYDGIKYLYDTLIFTNKKPTLEEEKRWYNTALKQRNIIDADWALANQNMSDKDSLYQKAQHTIHQIKIPTLHIWGKDDKTTPEYMINDNVEGIKNSKRITYDACGHAPFIDKPKELLDDILSFIS